MSAAFSIIDAHQHFWDPVMNYHPWLRDDPPVSFRYGDYGAIRRRYLPSAYLADAGSYAISGTVYVETEWDPSDPLGETRYAEKLKRETGLPTVSVAQAWLDHDDCAAVLEAQASFPFVRSIRHKPRANAEATDSAPGGMADATWRAGYAHLARNGLRFDLQTPWWHLHEAAQLARDFPDTQIILNHTGLPSERNPSGLEGWQRAMGMLARCPNVAVKISGLGQRGQPWTVAANRAIVLTTIDLFGASRCMFASNFPVDSLCGDFDTIFSGFREIVRDFSEIEQRALFHHNANRIYAMGLNDE
ncbi:MAG: amidohydrolase [Casimicrobiaceae bacterium]